MTFSLVQKIKEIIIISRHRLAICYGFDFLVYQVYSSHFRIEYKQIN